MNYMNREIILDKIESEKGLWDVVVIGGGATGLGAALESVTRKYKTLLLEKSDFSKGTSSRSTKLIHGGVRYLQQGNISLVFEALQERGILKQNAPHLVHNQAFIVPIYDWWDGPFYGMGLKVYDLLAGKLGIGKSKILSKAETIEKIENVETKDLRGGVIYYDGQFDDSRLAINIAQTINENNGVAINYMEVNSLMKTSNMISGVIAIDKETNKEYKIHSRVVINATGIFTNNIIKLDQIDADDLVTLSQGIHIVLEKKFLKGNSAIMVPHTEDGRVLFAVPWYDKVIVGTTDTKVNEPLLEPKPYKEEIEYILQHAQKYMSSAPELCDIKSIFAGIRPLIKPRENKNTSSISRDHSINVSKSGLVTITGGKWTTYRKMGEDVINQAALIAGLEERSSITKSFRIHGWQKYVDKNDPLYIYGSDAIQIRNLLLKDNLLAQKVSQKYTYCIAEIIWIIKNEMVVNLEDLMARRTRMIFLDAEEAINIAPNVVKLMAEVLNKNLLWQKKQLDEFLKVAQNYRIQKFKKVSNKTKLLEEIEKSI